MKKTIRNQAGTQIYQKVVFIIITCGVALGLAYVISKVAFDEMLVKVDKISTPNEKLRLVSQISRDILQIDQLQRSQVLNTTGYTGFNQESTFILQSLDTLQRLYDKDDLQSSRIDTIRILLAERDKLFKAYVQVRKSLVDNQAFSTQIRNISSLIDSVPINDSTFITTERSRTTIATQTIKEEEPAEDSRSFLGKLFGAKNKNENTNTPAEPVPETVQEELKVQTDTIRTPREKHAEEKIDKAIQNLEIRQKLNSSRFINHEAELTLAGSILINEMFNILHDVEQEAMLQMESENIDARNVVKGSVTKISLILLSFFILSAVLVFFVLADIKRGNRYRIELENAKNEAEYHSSAKQRFLSNMSHELRTPLQSIIGYVEQLKEDNPTSKKIDIVYQSSQHLLQIVNEILDYNKINSGHYNFQEEVVDLRVLADEVIHAMQPQADLKNLRLDISTKLTGEGLVLGDAFRLKQILFNLIGNAIKFTERGEVSLQVAATDYGEKTDISFRVSDTGTGIPQQDMKTIFNEFEQASNVEAGTHFGNGLGLTIVRTLTEAMGGEIKIKSALGRGSTFIVLFTLPTCTDQDICKNTQTLLAPVSDFKSSVWVIDDDRFILDLCDTILTKHKIKHVCFPSPSETLEYPYDADLRYILTDMRMPEINGKDLYKRLRETYGIHIKIIAFTAQALPEEREEILSFGFDGLLLKPFKEGDLLAAIGLVKDSKKKDDPAEVLARSIPFTPTEDRDLIRLFIENTESDMNTLFNRLEKGNLTDSELLVHRMAGRTAQFGGQKIAFKLRKMEIDIRNGDLPSIEEIQDLYDLLRDFMHELTKYDTSKVL